MILACCAGTAQPMPDRRPRLLRIASAFSSFARRRISGFMPRAPQFQGGNPRFQLDAFNSPPLLFQHGGKGLRFLDRDLTGRRQPR